jgi:N-acyl-L-homoserine lactone synthetase
MYALRPYKLFITRRFLPQSHPSMISPVLAALAQAGQAPSQKHKGLVSSCLGGEFLKIL